MFQVASGVVACDKGQFIARFSILGSIYAFSVQNLSSPLTFTAIRATLKYTDTSVLKGSADFEGTVGTSKIGIHVLEGENSFTIAGDLDSLLPTATTVKGSGTWSASPPEKSQVAPGVVTYDKVQFTAKFNAYGSIYSFIAKDFSSSPTLPFTADLATLKFIDTSVLNGTAGFEGPVGKNKIDITVFPGVNFVTIVGDPDSALPTETKVEGQGNWSKN